ncbi:MAG: D-alanine--D-alanine ligase [Buchnera aphidicola (Pentalonia nigronervosa)]|jgi:D-alanine-D-alanine ligase|uniref:D-alanine--D-alanine ligase n=1 Tax=Buchnera aphidicola (Pentalonia nigronervosa) TaxID=1309793 RepID=A0A7H1AZM6_9GAMM|nr:MAG: D-alanine--D-alanine ligase [Buchnera aphidicola (Pentalonia nigronervosa)]
MNKKIAVLLGGTSPERNISIISGSCVLKSLLKSGLNAHPIDTRDFPIMHLKKQKFNTAYIMLHGKGGEDGSIQGVLEYLNIPYTGSKIMSSAISMDKFRTKQLWRSHSLLTAPNIYLHRNYKKTTSFSLIRKKIVTLGLPVIVKPNCQGSSIGITRVNSIEDLDHALNVAFFYDNYVLIEKFLTGEEYTVPILGDKILPAVHVSTKHQFYDYHAKYLSHTTQYTCPSKLNIQQETRLKKIVMSAWNILGCSGYGRIDVILHENKKFYLLEVNTIPGMTHRSLLPISAKSVGISFDKLVLNILKMTY